MLCDNTTLRIRNNIGYVEHLSRYYGRLAGRWQNTHTKMSLCTIFGSVLAATLLLGGRAAPEEWVEVGVDVLSAAFFLLVTYASIKMVIHDYSRKAQLARGTSESIRDILTELDRLWHSGDQNIEQIANLEKRITAATKTELVEIDDDLDKKCHEEAQQILEKYYDPRTRTRNSDREVGVAS